MTAAEVLRETWEARALRHTRGKLGAVLMAVLFNLHAERMPILLRATFPGFRDLRLPQFTGCATVMRNGSVTCDMFNRDRSRVRNMLVFDSEAELIKEFRTLADELKLNDADRVALTEAVKKWVVADLRINHLGEKVA